MKFYKIMYISVFIIILLIIINTGVLANNKLMIYSAAGLIKPIEEITKLYQAKYDTDINIQYDASGVLMNKIKMVKSGDIYISADHWYINELNNINYILDYKFIAKHKPVIITSKQSDINEFKDILSLNTKVIIADQSAAIGRVTNQIFSQSNVLKQIENNIISRAETVNKVLMYIILGQADVGVVWHANYYENKDSLKLIEFPKKYVIKKHVSLGLLKFSNNKNEAKRFIDFIVGEKGNKIFKNYGYELY